MLDIHCTIRLDEPEPPRREILQGLVRQMLLLCFPAVVEVRLRPPEAGEPPSVTFQIDGAEEPSVVEEVHNVVALALDVWNALMVAGPIEEEPSPDGRMRFVPTSALEIWGDGEEP